MRKIKLAVSMFLLMNVLAFLSLAKADGITKRIEFAKSADFFEGDLVEGGRETYDGKNWVGKVPATGDYYIYVTAHPDARYKLKVSVK